MVPLHRVAKIGDYRSLYDSTITKSRNDELREAEGSLKLFQEWDLVFNRKIIIAPNRIVDYVVVHELCHMKQHDHSPVFWKCVERVFPDYAESKAWLKENGRLLEI